MLSFSTVDNSKGSILAPQRLLAHLWTTVRKLAHLWTTVREAYLLTCAILCIIVRKAYVLTGGQQSGMLSYSTVDNS
jgi:hypothetical protein